MDIDDYNAIKEQLEYARITKVTTISFLDAEIRRLKSVNFKCFFLIFDAIFILSCMRKFIQYMRATQTRPKIERFHGMERETLFFSPRIVYVLTF